MAGIELVTEGFKEGQVGSSAMPHKMNSRSCERVCGFNAILGGHLAMVAALSGGQWNEGDVSDSVVRRVALPDAFFALDGLFETFLTVLDEFGAYPAIIERENERYLPFLVTTKVLMSAVRAGVGREVAHEAIKESAVGVALAMREGGENDLIGRYPLRGIKGPMGTSQDMLDLLDGSSASLAELEQQVARHLGFDRVLTSVGQIYPRSLDLDVVSALVQLVSGPSNLATTIRLMAGIELVTEGFKEGQVGSSAMPHKMNSRSCERVNGLAVVLRGHLSMVGELAGDQWNEGDVSDSVVRRVALPDAFFATDGLFQTFLTVLDEFGAFPAVVQRELDRYLPFLTTTKVLMAAVRQGVGREGGHEAIKEHAVAVALEMRQGLAENDLFERLAADPRLGLSEEQIVALVSEPIEFTGAARDQIATVVRRIEEVVATDPDAAAYRPGEIL
jgi:adenylosuccinate lyase